jgi:protoheme IX farnesyltransferase
MLQRTNMVAQPIDSLTGISLILAKARAYAQLLKFRLSLLVAFSCAFGFVLASSNTNFYTLFMLFLGGFLLSGASVTINQVIEKDYDKLMTRTMNRPLPTGRLSIQEAIIFSVVCFVLSIAILAACTNLLTVALSVVSMILYCFVYTPLKRVGAIAVFVGAIPGALPPLLGWVAATGRISYEALLIFGIQFIWQFPHFWAIAWVADEDYKKAGFKLLPVGRTKRFEHCNSDHDLYLVFITVRIVTGRIRINRNSLCLCGNNLRSAFPGADFFIDENRKP